METLSEQICFGGRQGFYSHDSKACNGKMTFGVFVPPQAKAAPVPVLVWLAGLTCTGETFAIKAGAQRVAAELGLMLVTPDTSPRGQGIAGEDDDWDLGTGAGFYLDATQQPWATAYNMETYVTGELQETVGKNFAADLSRQGIFGHSMGGHGALSLHLRHSELFKSASAFAPIAAPMHCPWGQKAFLNYLGTDKSEWAKHDGSELVRTRPSNAALLVDQGLADQFLDEQLHPGMLEKAARESGQKLTLRRHEGYDHSYYFIQSFIEDHLHHHALALRALG
ncbi:MAG TPA: S-formylglutathione hydrolase [Devosia sp.]|nr:S-formylglutathione hydrolase [Devosia sp.]